MALAFAPIGTSLTILKINADDKTRRHLENLGIIVGTGVTSLSTGAGDMILKVKESRLAINKALAMKIIVA